MSNREDGHLRPVSAMKDSAVPLSFLLSSTAKTRYPHRVVAQFPHVAKRLDELWNDPDALADYFTDLLVSQRPNRKGFPPDVVSEIMTLSLTVGGTGHIKENTNANKASAPGGSPYRWTDERIKAEFEQLGLPRTSAGFARAAESGNRAACELFLRAGFNVDSRDARHWTPLMIASFNGREELALDLIKYGASIDAADIGGYTPLHWAAYNGFRAVVALLLRKGASVDVTSDRGITPLLQAAARGHVDTLIELFRHRADPNIVAQDGSTALLKAVANGHLDAVELLIERGASTDATMPDGVTLLDIARRARNPQIRKRIEIAAGLK